MAQQSEHSIKDKDSSILNGGAPDTAELANLVCAASTTDAPPRIFISYAHKDARWRDEFLKRLKPMLRNKALIEWNDTQIAAGEKWSEEIQHALMEADAAVLLVTPDFLDSDFIFSQQLPALLRTKILWIPVSDCNWQETQIQHYQAVHSPTQPLDGLIRAKRNSAWAAICREIKEALQKLSESKRHPPTLQEEVISTTISSSGSAALRREHYVHRKQEEELAKDYLNRGLPVILKGPRQYGKTMLLQYLLNVAFKEQDNLCINIHLGGMDAALDSLETLLRAISVEILSKTLEKVGNITEFKPGASPEDALQRVVPPLENADERIEEIITRIWRRPLTDVGRISALLERWIMPNLPGNLLIAFGHVEALCNRPYRDNFFRMCKFWLDQNVAASSATPPVQHWAKLRLLLEVPRRISLITIESNAGNIGEPIELQDFGLDQICQLRDFYGLGWQNEELQQLTQVVGGHPFLIDRLMLAGKSKSDQSLETLLANGYKVQGTFRNYLEELEGRINEQHLQEVICQIAHNQPYTLEEQSYLKLRDDGMIVEYVDEQGMRRYRMRYPLYKQFMQERCEQC